MAFLFKKQQKGAKIQKESVSKKKKENITSVSLKVNRMRTADVLRSPHVTERAALLGDTHGQYVFKVEGKSNKTEIKKAVEDAYGVHVSKVNITNVPNKTIRVGKHVGTKKGYKKAIVFLREGEKIELITR